MGVQSTVKVTRKKAEEMWVEMKLRGDRAFYKHVVNSMDDAFIEDEIQTVYFNYDIVSD